MEARQKAQQFIEECGFRKSKEENEMLCVRKRDFNATILARFMKEYAWELLIKATKDNGSFWNARKWWQENFAEL